MAPGGGGVNIGMNMGQRCDVSSLSGGVNNVMNTGTACVGAKVPCACDVGVSVSAMGQRDVMCRACLVV